MLPVILKIGGADLSDITEQEGVTISASAVWGAEFVSVTGKRVRKCLGESVSINASFGNVPEEQAMAIRNACNADSVAVTYRDPVLTTAVFERPAVECVPEYAAGENERYWNISVSMVCPLKGDGL